MLYLLAATGHHSLPNFKFRAASTDTSQTHAERHYCELVAANIARCLRTSLRSARAVANQIHRIDQLHPHHSMQQILTLYGAPYPPPAPHSVVSNNNNSHNNNINVRSLPNQLSPAALHAQLLSLRERLNVHPNCEVGLSAVPQRGETLLITRVDSAESASAPNPSPSAPLVSGSENSPP